jgi:hypothetical protein
MALAAPDAHSPPPVETCSIPSEPASANPRRAAFTVCTELTLTPGSAYSPEAALSSIAAYCSAVTIGIRSYLPSHLRHRAASTSCSSTGGGGLHVCGCPLGPPSHGIRIEMRSRSHTCGRPQYPALGSARVLRKRSKPSTSIKQSACCGSRHEPGEPGRRHKRVEQPECQSPVQRADDLLALRGRVALGAAAQREDHLSILATGALRREPKGGERVAHRLLGHGATATGRELAAPVPARRAPPRVDARGGSGSCAPTSQLAPTGVGCRPSRARRTPVAGPSAGAPGPRDQLARNQAVHLRPDGLAQRWDGAPPRLPAPWCRPARSGRPGA